MGVSINEFIEPISFEYFETYSFQRNGNYEVYETLFEKSLASEYNQNKINWLPFVSF
jgi:hypothetical protein